jgi:hypothetical protein
MIHEIPILNVLFFQNYLYKGFPKFRFGSCIPIFLGGARHDWVVIGIRFEYGMNVIRRQHENHRDQLQFFDVVVLLSAYTPGAPKCMAKTILPVMFVYILLCGLWSIGNSSERYENQFTDNLSPKSKIIL